MKIFTKTLFLAFTFLMTSLLFSQTVNVAPSPANCPGAGSVNVTTTGVTNPLFQLKTGAGVNIGSGSTSGTFTSLDAGNYQVQVTGEGGFTETHNFTINNTYVAIPTPTVTISGLCDNTFTLGGDLSVSVPAVAGKTYTYKVVLSNDPSFPDSTGTYVSTSTVTSITSFGKYQIRVKDECGQTVTLTKDIQPALQAITGMTFNISNTLACGSNSASMSGISFSSANGSNVSLSSYAAQGGVKVEMWERPGAACPTTVPATAPVFSQMITSSSGYVLPIVPSKRYVIRITTPCGEEKITCTDIINTSTPSFEVATSNSGCGASETMSIKGSSHVFLNYPVLVEIKDAGGSVVYSYSATSQTLLNTWAANNLPLGDYTVHYTDSCGVALAKTILNPKPATPPAATITNIQYTKYRCFDDNAGSLTVTGTTQVALTISGYIPNRDGATVTIISGPSNVGVAAHLHNNTLFAWTNMVPGDYTIRVNSGSGCTSTPIDLSFTVNPPANQILQQSLVSSGTSACSGGGSITSTVIYTGSFSNVVELLDSTGNVVSQNTSGTFTNLAPGTYTTRLHISTCTVATYYINNANPIIITDGSTGPQVVKKVGIVCEDTSGTPTSNGTAYFEIAGASPLIVQYKLLSEPDSALQTFSNNAPSTFAIPNLTPNETYQIVITSCGKAIRTNVIIQTPGVLSATNTFHPCVNNPYTLSAPDYAGASYEWTNDATGLVVSTTKDYYIPTYSASFDGSYTAKISWGGCVVRFIHINIDSSRCNQPIDDVCTKPATGGIPNGYSKVGITVQQKQENWPGNIPNGYLALESQEKGFVITRVSHVSETPAATDAIAEPKEGMIVYDIQDKCVKLYNGEKWKCIRKGCNDSL